MIRNNISPALLERIPTIDPNQPTPLLRLLKEHATSFRFMDLPVEIRNLVYVQYLTDPDASFDDYREQHCIASPSPDLYPALVHASSELRREALPVSFETATFWMSTRNCSDKADAESVNRWVQSMSPEHPKHLRRFRINLDSVNFVDFNYTKADGLSIVLLFELMLKDIDEESPHEWRGRHRCSRSLERRLATHTNTIGAACKALKLDDEAIVMAITTNPRFWKDIRREMQANCV